MRRVAEKAGKDWKSIKRRTALQVTRAFKSDMLIDKSKRGIEKHAFCFFEKY